MALISHFPTAPSYRRAPTSNIPPTPQWQYVVANGNATTTRMYIYMLSAGDVYVDDIKIVPGSTPEVGVNSVQNGDFESTLTPPWNVSANLAGSSIST